MKSKYKLNIDPAISVLGEDSRIPSLIAKDMLGCLETSEKAVLEEWLQQSEQNPVTYRMIRDNYQKDKERWSYYSGLREAELDRLIGTVAGRRRQILRNLWGYIAVAAVLVVGLGVIFFQFHRPSDSDAGEIVRYVRNEPSLILSSGERIALPDTLHAVIRDEGLSDIHVSGNMLSYEDSCGMGVSPEVPVINRLIVPKGGNYRMVLSDGSKVWLNSDSELHYPVAFNDTVRKVRLSGEGFFEVFPDKKKAFIVETVKGVQVRVLGTKFNLASFADRNLVVTTLSEGLVEVSTPVGKMTIAPDQQVIFDSNTGKTFIRQVDASLYSLWRQDMFGFSDEALEQILFRLSLWYDVVFEYEDEALRYRHFSGILMKTHSIDVLLDALQRTLSVKFVLHGKKITVME